MAESTYCLSLGEADEERLALINEIYNPASQRLVVEGGLRPGMKVLDVGCGTGIMTASLAKLVGSAGSVTGIDRSAEQLTIARKNVASINNIELRQAAVNELSDLDENFDLVYCRFLLIHLDDPIQAIVQMKARLKPGGILVLMEPRHRSHFAYPRNAAFDTFYHHAIRMLRINKRDPDLAESLANLVQQQQMTLKHIQHFMPILHSQHHKSLLPIALKSIYRQLQEDNIALEQLEKLQQELEALANDPEQICSFSDCLMLVAVNLN